MTSGASLHESPELCRGVSLPGVYIVAIGDAAARFEDNRYTGMVVRHDDPDAAVRRDPRRGGGWALADGWPPVPPWSDLATDLYHDVEEIAVDSVEVLGVTTASPFGDVRVHSLYENGRPIRRMVDEHEAAEISLRCDVQIRRRLSCVLLYRAQVVDLLGSLRGGDVSGDCTRLMLLAGLAEAPSVLAATESRSHRAQLIALALFAEAWAHQVDDALA